MNRNFLFAAISFTLFVIFLSTNIFHQQRLSDIDTKLPLQESQIELSVSQIIDSIEQTVFFQQLSIVHQNMLLNQLRNQHKTKPYKLQACWSPDTDEKTLKAFYALNNPNESTSLGSSSFNNFTFQDNSRWSTTATNGGGLQQGDPTTLTWSFMPDGTSIDGFIGEPQSDSDLIAFLDGLYDINSTGGNDLTQRAWFVFFQDIFDRWSALTGFAYVYEPMDDGAAMVNGSFLPRGSLGVRGDLRIGGHSIDGENGSNTLAYNFFPNSGDMVIDTDNGNLFGNTAGNSLLFRNTLSHEHGHGLGLGHSCPRVQTKLMEPFISSQFDGPQLDDILGANRGYGDNREPNDNSNTATNLGTLPDNITVTTSDLSIDDNSDTDYFAITATNAGNINITLSPVGTTYLAGPQNSDGSCSAGTNFSPQSQSDLSLELLAPDGSTVITTANTGGAGNIETISNQALTAGAGIYYIRVTGTANAVQLYELSSTVNYAASGCPANLEITAASVPNGIYEASNTLTTQNGTAITIPNGGNVTFQAGSSVTLNPGFTAVAGSAFIATIEDCNSSVVSNETAKFDAFSTTDLTVNTVLSPIEKDQLTAFPNPFESDFTISLALAAKSNVNIGLYDVTGRLEMAIIDNKNQDAGLYQYTLNTANIRTGIHFIYLKTEQGIQVQKLIKAN